MSIAGNRIRVAPGLSATSLVSISNNRPLSQWCRDSANSSTEGPQFPHSTPEVTWQPLNLMQVYELWQDRCPWSHKMIVPQWGAATAISPIKHRDTTAYLHDEYPTNTPSLYSTCRCLGGWDVVSLLPNDHIKSGSAELSRYSKKLQGGWSTDRIPVGDENFHTCPDQPWKNLTIRKAHNLRPQQHIMQQLKQALL